MTVPVVGVGVAPQVASAEARTPTVVQVLFSEPMAHTAELVDPASYTIDEDVGSAARTVEGVTPEPSSTPSFVWLELDGPLTLGVDNYAVVVADTVKDVAGNLLDAAHDEATFSGMHAPGSLDYAALAKARLLAQFVGKVGIEDFTEASVVGLQEIEQAALNVLAFRSLDTAYGATQDAIGELVDEARTDKTDADYRLFLKGKAKALGSRGRPDELIEVLRTLDNGHAPSAIAYADSFPAGFLLYCEVIEGDRDRARAFARILHQAKPNAVKFLLLFEETDVDIFGWALDGMTDTREFFGWAVDGDNGDSDPAGYWADASSGMMGEY